MTKTTEFVRVTVIAIAWPGNSNSRVFSNKKMKKIKSNLKPINKAVLHFCGKDISAIKKWLKEEKAECPVCRYKLSKIRKEKIETPVISRELLMNRVRENYMQSINTRIDNDNELYLQRLLLQQYE